MFTQEQAAKVKQAVQRVWGYIGYESLELAQELGEKMSNAACVQGCIDAGRLTAHGGDVGKEAEEIIKQAIASHGYSKVERAISRLCPGLNNG